MKSINYFSHDFGTRSDQKIKRLLFEMGMEGYGIFWSLVEDLYQNENFLELNLKIIASDYKISAKKIEKVVKDYNLFVLTDGFLSSKSVGERLIKINDRSLKASESANSRWNGKNDANAIRTAMQTQCEGNAIKEVKEVNKIKEVKEVNNSNANHFPPPPPPPLSEFISFAKLNKPNIDTGTNSKLVNRYNTYQASNWIDKDGNSIAEYWKAKVMAFLPHIDNQPDNNGYKRRTNLAKYINSEK